MFNSRQRPHVLIAVTWRILSFFYSKQLFSWLPRWSVTPQASLYSDAVQFSWTINDIGQEKAREEQEEVSSARKQKLSMKGEYQSLFTSVQYFSPTWLQSSCYYKLSAEEMKCLEFLLLFYLVWPFFYNTKEKYFVLQT